MKTFSEFDLARAIFTHQNHDIICHKAEIKKDILAGYVVIGSEQKSRFDKARDIMWDLEVEKREKAEAEAKILYASGNPYPLYEADDNEIDDECRDDEDKYECLSTGDCISIDIGRQVACSYIGCHNEKIVTKTGNAIPQVALYLHDGKYLCEEHHDAIVDEELEEDNPEEKSEHHFHNDECREKKELKYKPAFDVFTDRNIPSGQPMGIDTTDISKPNYPIRPIDGLHEIVGYSGLIQRDPGLFRRIDYEYGQGFSSIVPRKARETKVGFGPVLVRCGETKLLGVTPQLVFKPVQLIIPKKHNDDSIAEYFQINDIRVGNDSQFIAKESVPALAFLEGSIGCVLGCDTCSIGQMIHLNITNMDQEKEHWFYAYMIGTTIS